MKYPYPTFWDYVRKQYRGMSESLLTEARNKGLLVFLRKFYVVYCWDVKLKGFTTATHDWFIGKRIL